MVEHVQQVLSVWAPRDGVPGRAWLAAPPSGLRMGMRLAGAWVECWMLPRNRCQAQPSVRR